MKALTRYRNRDGQEHNLQQQAEDYALGKAHSTLTDLLKDIVPYVENPYKVAQDLTFAIHEDRELLRTFINWIDDAQPPEDEED